jgi:hypothetical protein
MIGACRLCTYEYGWLDLRRPLLRGRETVRADHRLGTDDKAIHAQSAILYENPCRLWFSQ